MKRFSFKKGKGTGTDQIELDAPHNEYYEKISRRFGIAQVILYFALFAFVVLSFLKNTQLITYQNFYYFMKDLNASTQSSAPYSSDSVSYPTDGNQSFTLYRKGIAVAGNNAVTVFTATGRQTVSQNISYQNPVAVGSGKYLLVYELGGLQYSLYNSYAQIHKGTSDYPILGAAVSESGMFALVSASESYTSTVSLYNDRFSLLNRYNKVGYVMDVSINEKGNRIAILSSAPKNGFFESELMICKPGKEEAEAVVELGDVMGWRCQFTTNDRISVLHESGVAFLTAKGKLESEFDFEGKIPLAIDCGRDGVALCLGESEISEKKSLIVFDKSGKVLYNDAVLGAVNQIARSGNTLYWLSDTGVHQLNAQNGRILFTECDVLQKMLIAPSDSEALLCSPKKADYIDFKP
jgi:hypothetical protein